jgi:hypothetical protein
MYFGLQDTKPPPCPLPLTKQGGSIHCYDLYCYACYKSVSYILATITMYVLPWTGQITNTNKIETSRIRFLYQGIIH